MCYVSSRVLYKSRRFLVDHSMRKLKLGILVFWMLSAGVFEARGQLVLNPTPARIAGHATAQLYSGAPNLVEGRELSAPQGVAVDMSSGAPGPVYVADTGNNRVLAWASAAALQNGMPADIIIGQRDRYSTSPQGPSTGFSSGLAFPVGLAVDASGNLYVADCGNNRVLRFPRPFEQRGDTRIPDMVIGQVNFSSSAPNAGGISAKTLALSGSGSVYYAGIAFDRIDATGRPEATSNLWVSDPGNNRILRFPAEALRAGTNGPAADLVIGQPDFTSNRSPAPPKEVYPPAYKEGLTLPAGLAFDPSGRLYVADLLNRVLVYTPPFDQNGKPASRILGVSPNAVTSPQQQPTTVSPYSLGAVVVSGQTVTRIPPQSLFVFNNMVHVLDGPANRILRFDRLEQWPSEDISFSPAAKAVFGQNDFVSSRPNRGQAEPGPGTFANPSAACVAGNDIYVVDSGNNRVLVFRGGDLSAASRVLGQDGFNFNARNLVEGREFYFAALTSNAVVSEGVGLAVDTHSETPALFVTDTYNNRVLGFRDVRQIKPGVRADLVIGQGSPTDFQRTLINYPSNDPNIRSESGLFMPAGVAVDPFGDLWVADTGNSRVLRYPKPFAQTGPIRPNLVIGQANFTTQITDATASTMKSPVGIAFTVDGNLLVSDSALNRVLYFERPRGGDFVNGQAATKVFGRDDFGSAPAANPDHRMSSPRGIAVDVDDRLYVADTGRNRVLVYDRIPATFGITAAPAFVLGDVQSPFAVAVGPDSGEIWVADTLGGNGGRVVRFPSYVSLVVDRSIQDSVPSRYPVGLAVDGFGNVIVAEAVNRVALFFPTVAGKNAASYHDKRGFAPGMIASLFAPNEKNCAELPGYRPRFTDNIFVFDPNVKPFRLPDRLGDTSVVVNGKPAPLFFVAPCQINFQVPNEIPPDNRWNIEVLRPSTGQILANLTMPFEPASPAFFTNDGSGKGQIAALNENGSRNSESDRAPYGSWVSLFGTGQGFVPDGPPDGEPAPSDRLIRTPETPTAFVGTQQADVRFSGLAPTLVGVWQVQIKIPDRTDPTRPVPVVVVISSRRSNEGPGAQVIQTTIWVKQP